MTTVDRRAYRFASAAHWQSGVRRNLELRGDRLVVPDQLAVQPIAGAGRAEGGALPAVDPSGRLLWLRPSSRQLVRRPHPGHRGVIELGTLDGPGPARRVVVGATLIWVVSGSQLDRHASTSLQRLSPVEAPPEWTLFDAASDGGDGLWVAEADTSGRWRLRHVDCWGRSCRPPLPVAGPHGGELTVTSTEDGRRLVVVDPVRPASLQVIDTASGIVGDVGLDPVHLGRPTLVTAGPGGRVHVVSVLPGARSVRGERVVYQSLDLRGDVEVHEELELPASRGHPTALAAGPCGVAVACSLGLAEVVPRPGLAGERRSTFITPALVSPPASRSGWSRAEIAAVLPVGTAMDVAWAATDDADVVRRATDLGAGPVTAGLLDELDALLPWRTDEMVAYQGTDDAVVDGALAAVLDGTTASTLWLRVRLSAPPGRATPELVSLLVRYPDVSYLDHLPALYREHAAAATQLRRVLAPYELLFDGMDETLAGLPDRIDPATANDAWTDYLLSWLGFPPLGDLPARLREALLEQAPAVLDRRGTLDGLQLLLDLVTGGRASVTDSSAAPTAWFLGVGTGPSVGAAPARLGRDTVSVAQQPQPSRAATMVVGSSPLGRACPDPAQVLAQQAAMVTITVGLDPEQEQHLRPIIERLLPVFVPAHCRVAIVRIAADSADRSRQLDVDLRLGPADPDLDPAGGRHPYDALLHSDAHWRLGATTDLGHWSVPVPRNGPAVLDSGAIPGAGQRLH